VSKAGQKESHTDNHERCLSRRHCEIKGAEEDDEAAGRETKVIVEHTRKVITLNSKQETVHPREPEASRTITKQLDVKKERFLRIL
jgi:hypothetical protein